MTSRQSSAARALNRARARVRQAALRRQLTGVVSGTSRSLTFDLPRSGDDAVVVINRLRLEGRWGRPEITRLAALFNSSGVLDQVTDGLASPEPAMAVACSRLTGALELELAVPWLEPLLRSDRIAVVEAAARALGKIKGTRAAEALTNAIQRRGPRRILVAELARAAPELYLEALMSNSRRTSVHSAAALAAGLRRRQVSTAPLLAMLLNGNRRQRAIGCRALGWIGARTAIPLIEAALQDREQKVRHSAGRALAALGAVAA
jgi:HEAT repeat protein